MRRTLYPLLLAAGAISAADIDGQLDTSFGDGGRTAFGYLESTTLELRAMAKYAGSGRIWLFGDDVNDPGAIYIARTFASGQPDTGFGPQLDGRRRLTLPNTTIPQTEAITLLGATMQNDGKPLLFGGFRAINGDSGMFPGFVCRLTAAGTFDGGYGVGGCRLVRSFLDANETCSVTDVAVDAFDVAVAVGNCEAEQMDERPFVARLTNAGGFDTEFAGGVGMVLPDAPQANIYQQHLAAVALRPDGRIVTLGDYLAASNSQYSRRLGLSQFDLGGTPDPEFDGDGFVFTKTFLTPDHALIARDLALRPDGRAVVLGQSEQAIQDGRYAYLAQHLENGAPDPDFGDAGDRREFFGSRLERNAELNRIELDASGRINLIGAEVTGQPALRADTGTDFWIAFAMGVPPAYGPELHLSGEFATTGTITNAALGLNIPFAVTPGTVTRIDLPEILTDYVDAAGTVPEDLGLHVVAQAPIAVVALGTRSYSVDTSTILPTQALGKDYRVMAWGKGLGVGSQVTVVASQNDTRVTLTPSVEMQGHAAGVPYVVILQQGQVLRAHANLDDLDATGTRVTADKPVAVFGGHSCATVPNDNTEFCDYLYEQQRPVERLGQLFFHTPSQLRPSGDVVRVLAHLPGTTVWINDVRVATLDAGEHYETLSAAPARIATSRPAAVAEFMTGCRYDWPEGECPGDPFMTLLPPTTQWSDRYLLTFPDSDYNDFNYLQWAKLIVPSSEVDHIYVDGVALPGPSFGAIGNSSYREMHAQRDPGSDLLIGPAAFGATVYGACACESYGHAAQAVPRFAPDSDDFVVRLLPDGSLDPSFGDGGIVDLDHATWLNSNNGSFDRGRRIIVDGGGLLIGSATTHTEAEQNLLLVTRMEAGHLFKDGFD
jgi:uncharacterized delta-60 repeat protein